MNRLITRIQLWRDRLLGRHIPEHMELTFHGTPTQARAFLDSYQMQAQHLSQDGQRITVTAKDYPMTECQLGLHQPVMKNGAPVCAKCGRKVRAA